MSLHQQASELEQLLGRDDLPDDVRDQLISVAQNLRSGVIYELIPPNIPSDEPIPGRHVKADQARAASPTGDLPRTDRTPAPPPEEVQPPHAFGSPVLVSRAANTPSVGDMNPAMEPPIHEEGTRLHIPLPSVEHAVG